MFLGVSCLKRAGLVLTTLALASLGFLSCGYSGSGYKKPGSGLDTRVLVSQSVSSPTALAGLLILNAAKDTYARASELNGGNSPGMMTLSPTRATLLAFDSGTNTVQVVDTRTETNIGKVQLPGPTTSIVIPVTTRIGYAAVPTAANNLFTSPGGIVVMNIGSGGTTTTIGVPKAQTVVSNPNGTQLLVFSSDSDFVSVVSPGLAVPPVDQGCDTAPNTVCTIVPGFDRPVFAIWNGNTAYVLNCGAECGGTQASVQVLDTATMTPGPPLPVDGATFAFLKGTTLYVAGTSPVNNACTGQKTAATICGRLSIVDLGSMTVTASVVITDGYHDRMDMSSNGRLFIGARTCTNIGNINNPSGEVRGCLSIFDTMVPGNTTAAVPSDNGDVTGLQSFTSYNKEYVTEGGNLRIYDTTKNTLQKHQIAIVGDAVDVKAIDFF